jgi:hypothetical protein
MATIGQEKINNNLLRGLSSFWNRFFKDKEVIEHLYSANDQLMGQLYLELLETLLCNTIKDVPVFSKDFWKLITFNSIDVEVVGLEYKYPIATNIIQIRFLYNRIFGATSILEEGHDYRIENGFIYFTKNIFDDLIYPGFAKRREGSNTIISMWAPEALVDKEYVYEYFGRMLYVYQPSSESYKAFIRGVWFYYMNGPTITRITSALHIISGYPVASEDGEIVLSIKHIPPTYYIKTTSGVYEVDDKAELRVEVGDVLSAFDYMTDSYTVTDYIDNPHWFDHIIVPIEVIPSLSTYERTTNVNDPNPIFIGYPILIGDPRWYIGGGQLPNFMWLLFNEVLKYNIFYVTYDALASQFLRSTTDLQDIVLSGKPAWDLAMVVPYIKSEDTVELPTEDDILFDGTYSLANLYDLTTLGDDLLSEAEITLGQESYGRVPISFGDLPTLIGVGRIGDAATRLADNVPELIGIDTIGLTASGLYSEFPLVIVEM